MSISRRGFVRMGAAAAAGAVRDLLKFIDDVEAGCFPKGKAKA